MYAIRSYYGAQAIYDEDRSAKIRKSYQNPAIAEIYDKFLSDGPS